MRINDNSMCSNCKHFEHDCGYDYCSEWCLHPEKRIGERFYDDEVAIINCEGYKERF